MQTALNTPNPSAPRATSRSGGEPTWRENLTAPWRALPNLLLLGAQKAGTTSLHDFLGRHPEIRMSRIKECHVLWKPNCSLRRYRAFFPLKSHCRANDVKYVGESTPYYLFHPSAVINAAQLDAMLRAEGRELRTIVVLRDPVERAWSQFQHETRHGAEQLTFFDAISTEESRIRESSVSHQRHSYQARGLYAEQLERWFAMLGRERVLVLEFRELLTMDVAIRERIRLFLGIEKPFEGVFPSVNRGGAEHVPEEARARLSRFFEEPNRRLEQLLGMRFSWMSHDAARDAAGDAANPVASAAGSESSNVGDRRAANASSARPLAQTDVTQTSTPREH